MERGRQGRHYGQAGKIKTASDNSQKAISDDSPNILFSPSI
jgi:hypothetical protein